MASLVTLATQSVGGPAGSAWANQVKANFDTLNSERGARPTYTPTLSGITIGNGTLDFRYRQVDQEVFLRGAFVAGSTTTFTAASTLSFSLPVAALGYATGHAIGQAWLLDSSVGSSSRLAAIVCITGSSVFFVSAKDTSATVTDTAPWTWANGDQIYFSAQYEAA